MRVGFVSKCGFGRQRGSLEDLARREGYVYVPVRVELALELEREPIGPVSIRMQDDLRGNPLLRTLVITQLS